MIGRAALCPTKVLPLLVGEGGRGGAARRGGTVHMKLLMQHSVGENPYSRQPLSVAMRALALRPDLGGRPLLYDTPLHSLHPASW